MLSKPSGMVLPMLAFALLMFGRLNKRALLWLLPWVILSTTTAIIARLSQAATNVPHPPLYQRPFIAADTIWFYLLKLLWPGQLCIDYGQTPQKILSQSHALLWIKLASIVIFLPIGWMLCARSMRRLSIEAPDVNPGLQRADPPVASAVIVGTLLFLAAVAPVLGLVCFDFQEYSTTADHYLYLAMIGPALAVAAILTRWPNRLLHGLAAMWILWLGTQSFSQCRVWKDAISVNQHAIAVNDTSWVAHLNLAYALSAKSPELAIKQALRACELRPENPRGWSCLAAAYSANCQPGAAREAARNAMTLRPQDPALLAALGQYADDAGDWSQAIVVYQSALKYDPGNINVMCNLAAILAEHDHKEEAAKWYQQALKQSPELRVAKAGLAKLNAENKPPSNRLSLKTPNLADITP